MTEACIVLLVLGLAFIAGVLMYSYLNGAHQKPDPQDFNGLIPKDRGDGAGF